MTLDSEFNSFFDSYIECALFSETDDNGNPLDATYERKDIAPETLKRMRDDCVKFWEANADKVRGAYVFETRYTDAELAGHDFWLTRNRHGTGFWDGDWNEDIADDLDKAAHDFGECNLYVGDDRQIHVYPG